VTASSLDRQARAYAKRMRTENGLALTVPEEWDFRTITEAELPIAIKYEYLRESAAECEAVTAWLETKVKRSTIRGELLRGVAFTNPLFDLEYPPAAPEVSFLGKLYPLFPVPWLMWDRPSRMACSKGMSRFLADIRPPVVLRKLSEMKPGECVERAADSRCYFLSMDLDKHTAKDILRAFEAQLRKEAKKHKKQSGKASGAPWQKLKWLAARRLANAGLKYPSDANTGVNGFIQQHLKAAPGRNSADVLPQYASSGAWYDALAMAKAELAASA
jgi:hypothetical protein